MKTLQKPKFRHLSHGECTGAPILKKLWDRFDFSLLLTQSGMFKRCGTPSWLICFLYVIGLVSNCPSVNQIADLAERDALLRTMFKPWKLAQYTLSRFLSSSFAWRTFGKKRVERMQQEPETCLQEGDVVNLDDTHRAHPYAKKLPLQTYVKRWRIEVFFRTAKQELGFEKCHSESEAPHHAHFELFFTAETLLAIAQLELNKEKTSVEEGYTHGEMVRGLFHTRCQIHVNNHKGIQRISLDCDTKVQRFARLIDLFWPDNYSMRLWVTPNPKIFQVLVRSA